MSKKIKTHTPEFKAKAVKELLKQEKTQAEIASQYSITTKTLQLWHKQFQEGVETVFIQGTLERKHKEEVDKIRKELDEAYKEIGSLTVQVNWLKKKSEELGIKY